MYHGILSLSKIIIIILKKKKKGTLITVGEATYGELERARYVQAQFNKKFNYQTSILDSNFYSSFRLTPEFDLS